MVAGLHGAHLHRRLAHLLYNEGDGPPLAIIVGDGQRDTLTLFRETDDDKLASLGLLGHGRGPDLEQLGYRGQVLFGQDFVHADASLHVLVRRDLEALAGSEYRAGARWCPPGGCGWRGWGWLEGRESRLYLLAQLGNAAQDAHDGDNERHNRAGG